MAVAAKALAKPETVLYLRQGAFFLGVAAITMIGVSALVSSTTIGENWAVKNFWGERIGVSGVAAGVGAIALAVSAALLDSKEVANISPRLRMVMFATMGIATVVLLSAKALHQRGWISEVNKTRLHWISGVALVAIPAYILLKATRKAPAHFISKTYQGVKSGISYVVNKVFKRG